MAQVSKQLLRKEINDWKTIKRMFSRQTNTFGHYMNKRYVMKDKELEESLYFITAVRILLDKHVIIIP